FLAGEHIEPTVAGQVKQLDAVVLDASGSTDGKRMPVSPACALQPKDAVQTSDGLLATDDQFEVAIAVQVTGYHGLCRAHAIGKGETSRLPVLAAGVRTPQVVDFSRLCGDQDVLQAIRV